MDNEQKPGTEYGTKEPVGAKLPPTLWFAVGAIVLAGLAVGTYVALSKNSSLFSTSTNGTANQSPVANANTAARNVNGILFCTTSSDCPAGFSCARVDNVATGGEDRVCVSDAAFNVNAVNANTNVNVNANSNANTNVDTTPVKVAAWQTVTYQRADHGFSLSIPDTWTSSTYSSGLREGEIMLSAYISATAADDLYVNLGVQYFAVTGKTLAQWVTAHLPELKRNNEQLTQSTGTLGGESAIYVTSVTSANAENQTPGYQTRYGYVLLGSRIYEVSIGGSLPSYQRYESVITKMYADFKFIDPLPVVQIPALTTTAKIGAELGYEIQVKWLASPKSLNIIDPALTTAENGVVQRSYYQVGEVLNGLYQGQALVLIFETPDGPAFSDNLYRVIYNESAKTITYLEKYSDNLSYFKQKFAYDTSSTILNIAVPTTIAIPNSTVSLREATYSPNRLFSYYTDLKKVFADPVAGPVYFNGQMDCYAVETPDHLINHYRLVLPWAKNYTEGQYTFDPGKFVPDVLWLDTTGATAEYSLNEPGGCGNMGRCQAVTWDSDTEPAKLLEVTGQTANGDKVYEYTDTTTPALKDMYDTYYVAEGEAKPSYDTFVRAHPVFFWKDPFGYWIQFKMVKYFPMAECGKPVIYLYPTATTDVNVQVAPTGGFTVTEPTYPTGGWQVTAQPDGTLSDSSGTAYPYLFWEGIALNYARPTAGFVVPGSQVKSLLTEKLATLGLNAKESADFMEFWLPKLQGAPYYFITFLDQAVFDTLAPLTVSPQPDVVIRVFMDYQPLQSPISVQPLPIRTPQRHGFTVVEWGGALNR
ncbi:MAG: hypothetical protein V1916_00900 [Patescibacteria group bacterium]